MQVAPWLRTQSAAPRIIAAEHRDTVGPSASASRLLGLDSAAARRNALALWRSGESPG